MSSRRLLSSSLTQAWYDELTCTRLQCEVGSASPKLHRMRCSQTANKTTQMISMTGLRLYQELATTNMRMKVSAASLNSATASARRISWLFRGSAVARSPPSSTSRTPRVLVSKKAMLLFGTVKLANTTEGNATRARPLSKCKNVMVHIDAR